MTLRHAAAPPDAAWWWSLALAMSIAVATVTPAFLVGASGRSITEDLDMGSERLGLAVSAFFVATALGAAAMGRLGDRWGVRVLGPLGLVISAVCVFGIAAGVRSWAALVATLALGGLGNACGIASSTVLLVHELPPARYGFGLGARQASVPLASALSGLAVSTVVLRIGWRQAFVVVGVVTLLLAVRVARRPQRGRPAAPRGRRAGRRPDGALVLLAVGFSLVTAAATGFSALFAERSHDAAISTGTAGSIIAVAGITSVAVRFLLGWFVDRWSNGFARAVPAMLVTGAVGFAAVGLSGFPGGWLLAAAGAMAGLGLGWGWPGLMYYAVARRDPTVVGASAGILSTGGAVGGVVGPTLLGYVGAHQGLVGMCWAAAGLSGVAAVVVTVGMRRL